MSCQCQTQHRGAALGSARRRFGNESDPFMIQVPPCSCCPAPSSERPAVTRCRPTAGIECARHLMDMDEDSIVRLIEGGELSHAWNIGLGRTRSLCRILRASIDEYMAANGRPVDGGGDLKPSRMTDAQVFNLLLPPGHSKPYLTGPELLAILNCSSSQLLALIAAKALKLERGCRIRKGRNGFPLVTVDSVRAFIERRRIL